VTVDACEEATSTTSDYGCPEAGGRLQGLRRIGLTDQAGRA